MAEEQTVDIFEGLFAQAVGQEKPNFSQYSFAISEITEALRFNPKSAMAFRRLRHLMEKNFKLETLDDLVEHAIAKVNNGV